MAEEFPVTLQGVSLTALSVGELSAFRSNDSDIGPPTNELLSEDVPTFFEVSWIFFSFDFQIFENWFKHTLVKGVKSFTIKLPVGAGLLEHECNFLPGRPYTAQQQNKLISVSATLRAIEKQTNTEADFSDLLLLANMVSDKNKVRVFDSLVRFANITLPDVFDTIKYGTDYS